MITLDCTPTQKTIVRATRLVHPAVRRAWFPYIASLVTLVSRMLTSGRPYFGDGPAHIEAITNHVYAIQPPGYWLFTRLASLFPDPAMGIHYINWASSALGIFVFYFVATRMLALVVAELATGVYASVYIAWFAGGIHSTYATELLFPVLMVFFILRHREQQRVRDLIGASVSFSLAAGFRPSDGSFLGPLFIFFLARYVLKWRRRALAMSLACALCFAWLIPNQLALRNATAQDHGPHANTILEQLRIVAPFRTFRTRPREKTANQQGPTKGSAKLIIANTIRLVFPLTLAFWPLVPWLFRRDEFREFRILVWLWIIPGLSFFLLVFMSDAVYLCYLLGGVVLSACIGRATRKRLCALLLCIVFNFGFYIAARPIVVTSATTAVFDVYGAKYTYWSIRHEYFKNLKDVYPPDRARRSEVKY